VLPEDGFEIIAETSSSSSSSSLSMEEGNWLVINLFMCLNSSFIKYLFFCSMSMHRSMFCSRRLETWCFHSQVPQCPRRMGSWRWFYHIFTQRYRTKYPVTYRLVPEERISHPHAYGNLQTLFFIYLIFKQYVVTRVNLIFGTVLFTYIPVPSSSCFSP